jgi:hypothetical protein
MDGYKLNNLSLLSIIDKILPNMEEIPKVLIETQQNSIGALITMGYDIEAVNDDKSFIEIRDLIKNVLENKKAIEVLRGENKRYYG